MAAGERQFLQLTGLDDGANRWRRPVEERGGALDGDRFLDPPDLQLQIEREVLPDLEPDVVMTDRLESGKFGGDGVLARREKVEDVEAGVVGDRLALEAGGRGLQLDDDAGKHPAAGIRNRAVERRGRCLCSRDARQQEQGESEDGSETRKANFHHVNLRDPF